MFEKHVYFIRNPRNSTVENWFALVYDKNNMESYRDFVNTLTPKLNALTPKVNALTPKRLYDKTNSCIQKACLYERKAKTKKKLMCHNHYKRRMANNYIKSLLSF